MLFVMGNREVAVSTGDLDGNIYVPRTRASKSHDLIRQDSS